MDEFNTNAMLGIANVNYSQGNFSLALIQAGKALKLNENLPRGHFLEARARHQLGYFERALESYSLAIKLDKNFGDAYLYRGALKVQLNKGSKACDDFRKANNLGIKDAAGALSKYCK